MSTPLSANPFNQNLITLLDLDEQHCGQFIGEENIENMLNIIEDQLVLEFGTAMLQVMNSALIRMVEYLDVSPRITDVVKIRCHGDKWTVELHEADVIITFDDTKVMELHQ